MVPDLNPHRDGDRAQWVLRARGLACARGERLLFSGFELTLAAGDIAWLRAPNGFGKTSLMRVIAGLSKPAAGTLEWREPCLPILYLAHANALKDDLTAIESLRFLAQLHGLTATNAALIDGIRHVGLHARRHAPVRTLSQGQRRRVALARLWMSQPHAAWLLDEPYDALDSEGSDLVSGLLARHAAGGGCVLFTSHVAPAIPDVSVQAVRLDAQSAA